MPTSVQSAQRNRWTEDPFLHRQMRKQWQSDKVRARLEERTGKAVGAARPGLELRGLATPSPSTESEGPGTHKV